MRAYVKKHKPKFPLTDTHMHACMQVCICAFGLRLHPCMQGGYLFPLLVGGVEPLVCPPGRCIPADESRGSSHDGGGGTVIEAQADLGESRREMGESERAREKG